MSGGGRSLSVARRYTRRDGRVNVTRATAAIVIAVLVNVAVFAAGDDAWWNLALACVLAIGARWFVIEAVERRDEFARLTVWHEAVRRHFGRR